MCYNLIDTNTKGGYMINVRQKIFEKVIDFVVMHNWIRIFNFLCSSYFCFVDAYIRQIEKEVEHIKIEMTEQEKQEQWEKLCKKIREYEEGKENGINY